MSSSELTNSLHHFSEGWGGLKPPTSILLTIIKPQGIPVNPHWITITSPLRHHWWLISSSYHLRRSPMRRLWSCCDPGATPFFKEHLWFHRISWGFPWGFNRIFLPTSFHGSFIGFHGDLMGSNGIWWDFIGFGSEFNGDFTKKPWGFHGNIM